MASTSYVHGYSPREGERLADQARTLSQLLHRDTSYPPGSLVLECGCGTGAQTVLLAASSPQARIVSVDLSPTSIAQARARVETSGYTNVTLQVADLMSLPFADASFDHLFFCFVLEHLRHPEHVLRAVRRVLRPGGTITAIEGDHGSWYCHPQTAAASRAVQCLVDLQARAGGDSLIGRRLYPLLRDAGFAEVSVSPRQVYADDSRAEMVDGFSKKTFIAMVEGVRAEAISAGLIGPEEWDRGIADLYRATDSDGTFCYTFFKAVAVR